MTAIVIFIGIIAYLLCAILFARWLKRNVGVDQ